MSGGGSSVDLDVITAEAGDILAGKTGIDPEGDPLPGTMTNRTNMGKSPGISDSHPTTPVHVGTYPQVNVATKEISIWQFALRVDFTQAQEAPILVY